MCYRTEIKLSINQSNQINRITCILHLDKLFKLYSISIVIKLSYPPPTCPYIYMCGRYPLVSTDVKIMKWCKIMDHWAMTDHQGEARGFVSLERKRLNRNSFMCIFVRDHSENITGQWWLLEGGQSLPFFRGGTRF